MDSANASLNRTAAAALRWQASSRPRSLAGGWRLGRPRLLGAIPLIAICLAAWAAFAPPQLAGSTTYVITDGISMLPRYQAGDLVLLRRAPSYHVGEVAGYHNAQLGVTVMHRIVAVHGDHYVFKGDNNSWDDSYQPTAAQIVGAEWIHLPGWGNALQTLRSPLVAAVVVGLLWLLLFVPRPGSRRRRRRHAQ
ncbi:MAG TPA: S24/S26 family peptidase [Candidatus Dormibacteraeota bacterium]